MQQPIIKIDKSIWLASLEAFKDIYMVLYNVDRQISGLPEVTDEDIIMDMYLDELNKYKREQTD
jgi:hypothetical protein